MWIAFTDEFCQDKGVGFSCLIVVIWAYEIEQSRGSQLICTFLLDERQMDCSVCCRFLKDSFLSVVFGFLYFVQVQAH